MSKFRIVRRKKNRGETLREIEFHDENGELGSLDLFYGDPGWVDWSASDKLYINIKVDFLSPSQAKKVAAELLKLAEEAES